MALQDKIDDAIEAGKASGATQAEEIGQIPGAPDTTPPYLVGWLEGIEAALAVLVREIDSLKATIKAKNRP